MPTTSELIERAKAIWAAMSPAERDAMIEAQRQSFARAEAGFGSDANEAAYARALRMGDIVALGRLDAEARARIARVNPAAWLRQGADSGAP